MSDYEQIISLLETKKNISSSQILEWMKSEDIKVLGALYVLTDKAWHRITPELRMEKTCDFILSYYTRCIKENPDSGDYLHNRYNAGWEMASWIKHLWSKKPETDKVLDKVKNALAEVFLHGDKEIRDCITNAVLEHVFEEKEIVSLFKDWQENPQLKQTYNAAIDWGKEFWNK